MFYFNKDSDFKIKINVQTEASLSFHIHVLKMGEAEIGIYFRVTADILTKVLLKCFWSSPLPTI